MAAAVQSGSRSLRSSIFDSVFPLKNHTTATPETTPNIGTLAAEGTPFGGIDVSQKSPDLAVSLARWWSAATRVLTLPPGLNGQIRDLSTSPEAQDALESLLKTREDQKQLLDWYSHEISTHFRHFVLPELSFWQQPLAVDNATQSLSSTVQILQRAQRIYFATGKLPTRGRRDKQQRFDAFWAQIKRDFHVLVLHSLPRQRVQKTLSSYLFQCMKESLHQSGRPIECLADNRCRCSVSFDLSALRQLQDVGLGGNQGERAFAHAVHKLLQGPAIERRCFQVDWSQHDPVIERLRLWVRERLVPSLEQAVATLAGDSSIQLPIHQFVSAAVNSIGRLRSAALFDYVTRWPDSSGAIRDIKEYINANGAQEKAYLCSSFSEQIQRRLFHAGASTSEILSVYISVIDVFQFLDSRGVLLEKVAIPIRSYLRSREDTASIIASSFLCNRFDPDLDQNKNCIEFADTIVDCAVDAREDRVLNWDDMEWMPDPIDAGPNYKSSKSDDHVAHIIGLFEPDDFVKAFSNTLGQHLLQRDLERTFDHEIWVIELLKSRLDASKLQHAEVMLMDMRTSAGRHKRWNANLAVPGSQSGLTTREIHNAMPDEGISLNALYSQFSHRMESKKFQAVLKFIATKRQDLYFAKRARVPSTRTPRSAKQEELQADPTAEPIKFEAKVLSSYFWPQLREAEFTIPAHIRELKTMYEKAFQSQSGQRRLDWKSALDTMDIELELEDRTIEETGVEVWKGMILDSFRSDHLSPRDTSYYDSEVGLSVETLTDALAMPEEFVQSGISYWITKRVLYEKSAGMYAVLERLDMEVQIISDASQLDMEDAGGIMSEQAMLRQNAATFQTFIEQMLRNSGAKEIGGMMGITNVMKMVLPTFTYGDDEVRWLLEDMESKGIAVKKGEQWTVV